MSNETVSRVKIDISLSAILKILAVLFGLIFLQRVQDILLLFFVVVILVTALSPVVDSLVKQLNVPRWLMVALIFGGVAILAVVLAWLVLPLIVQQISELFALPQVQNVLGSSESGSVLQTLSDLSGKIPGLSQSNPTEVIAFFSTVFGGVVSVVTVFVLSLYLLLDKDGIKKFIMSVLPRQHKLHVVNVLHKISLKMGSWLRGQLLLGLIIGLADMAVLLIFGVPFWLTLALFAGFTELIPYIGPFLGLAAALFVVLTKESFWGFNHLTTAVGVLVGYLIIQQFESHFLVPKVMEKTVGLSPVIVIIAILIGAKLFGLIGVMLSVPVAAAISVVIDEWPAIQAAYYSSRTQKG